MPKSFGRSDLRLLKSASKKPLKSLRRSAKNPAKDHLIEYAQQHDMDLIVISNSIRNLILRHLLGDTALNAIRQSDRPLFLAQ
jgi:nucleotide-binding universal stress UspA family protein